MPEYHIDALWTAFTLLAMTSIFWIPALIIGYLWRNRKDSNATNRNMKDRLDIALAQQRLKNIEREQSLEYQRQLNRARDNHIESDGVGYVEAEFDEPEPPLLDGYRRLK